MVEQATLNFITNTFNKNNFCSLYNKKTRFFYLDTSHKIVFLSYKFNSIDIRYFCSRKTLKRLRYLKSLNSKKKPR